MSGWPAVIVVRVERPEDQADVRRVIEAAFGRRHEAALVDVLRAEADLAVSLIASVAGTCVGYAGLPRMRSPAGALALAPVAVLPEWQRRGVGKTLIAAALEAARRDGFATVFVLGDPGYYGRSGFTAAAATRFPCVYSGPHFMAVHLSRDGPEAAPAIFARAFDSLD